MQKNISILLKYLYLILALVIIVFSINIFFIDGMGQVRINNIWNIIILIIPLILSISSFFLNTKLVNGKTENKLSKIFLFMQIGVIAIIAISALSVFVNNTYDMFGTLLFIVYPITTIIWIISIITGIISINKQ
jgi:peptidoglycan/LPS O-acetylase OafA/YrhL